MSDQIKSYKDLLVWQRGIDLYVTDDEAQTLDQRITELRKMLHSLVSKL